MPIYYTPFKLNLEYSVERNTKSRENPLFVCTRICSSWKFKLTLLYYTFKIQRLGKTLQCNIFTVVVSHVNVLTYSSFCGICYADGQTHFKHKNYSLKIGGIAEKNAVFNIFILSFYLFYKNITENYKNVGRMR